MKGFYWLTITSLKCFFRLFYRLSVYGIDHPLKGKAIIAPNHASFFDPPLIGATWPEEVHYLARATLFQGGLGEKIIRNLHAHPVHGTAQDIEAFRLIGRLLDEGGKVVIFPEGERTQTGEIMPIKSGTAMLALRLQCPIIPVYIKGSYDAWSRHKRWPSFNSPITCVYGKPIFPQALPNMNKRQQQEHLTQQIQEKWEELRLWLEAGAKGTPP